MAPTSPTPGIGGDRGIAADDDVDDGDGDGYGDGDGDSGEDPGFVPTPAPTGGTPAPTDPGYGAWAWWFQTGGPRGDRGTALVNGAGEHIYKRYLVGTEDGVVAVENATSAGESRTTGVALLGPLGGYGFGGVLRSCA